MMTPTEFQQARKTLGLTQDQAALLFARSPRQVKTWEKDGPDGLAARYMRALLSGYRPDDWPI